MTDGCYGLRHMPAGMGKLTSLQKLPLFIIGEKKTERSGRYGLRDLKDLNDLRGELSINNLERIGVEDAAEESKEANMKEKTSLQSLKLDWEFNDSRADHTEREQQAAELVLEGLQPHSDLKEFFIDRYCGAKFPSWMRTMDNVVRINFWNCATSQQLPSLDQLPCLKFLYIGHLKELEYIQEEGYGDDNNDNQVVSDPSSSSSALLSFFPSLQALELQVLPKLKGWWRRGEESVSSSSSSEFPKLTKLYIWNCPMLTSMPLHPNLEVLKLSDPNVTLVPKLLTTTTSLESLVIFRGDELAPLPCLTSLQRLYISSSPILAKRFQKEIGQDWPNIARVPNIIIDDQVIQGRIFYD